MQNEIFPKRKRNRLPGFDYSDSAAYFVTICVQYRECVFGDIFDGIMALSANGQLAEKCWRDIPNHFPQCRLYEFVVMPNHVHGTVHILGNPDSAGPGFEPTEAPHHRKLPVIIGAYKAAVTKLARQTGHLSFQWQKSYYDRIIRDENELSRVRQYILENPARWANDVLNQAEKDRIVERYLPEWERYPKK